MPETFTPKFELLIEGSPADQAVAESVVSIRARVHLDMADMVEVVLNNHDLAFSESDTFAEGKKLAVKLGYVETSAEQVVAGEIVRREVQFPVRGPMTVTVVAYDREHRLKRGVKSRIFTDMKDSDVVSQLAGEAGLSAEVDATDVQHKYLFQNAQTNLSFIRERAAALDYEVQVDHENAKLFFRKSKTSGGPVAELKWGKNLLSFAPRMTTDEQVQKVIVRGWDITQKVKIEGVAEKGLVAYSLDGADPGPKVAETPFGAREVLYVDTPVFVQGEADAIAKARINQRAKRFCEGEASCQGDPKILAGTKVKIDGCGKRANGEYYVTEAFHALDASQGYVTRFVFLKSSQTTATEPPPELPQSPPPPQSEPAETPNWVKIKVTSESGESLEGMAYTVTLPNGQTQQGTLDATGEIKVENIREPGECKVELTPPPGVQGM